MDITPELLRNNSEFRSLSPDKQTEVLESFAKDQRPELLQMFLEGSNRLMEEISRESGIGRVYVEKKVMESLRDVLPPDYYDLDDDAKVTAIDAALPKLEERVAELDPVNRNDTRFYAERILSNEQRKILGKEVGDVGDKTKRFVGGVIQSFAAPFDEEGTRNWLNRNLPTNPDYDQTTASQLTQAAGDFVGQIGQFAAIAALAAPSGGASVGLLGLRGGAGIAMGISTAQNAARKFQENYNLAVGEMGLPEDEALAAGIAGMPGAVIDSFGDALLLKGIKLGSASKAFSSMSATEKAAEIVAKGSQVLKDPTFIRTASKNLFKGFLKEGLTESLGDAATAWGGYATSGHEGFKPSAESLWQSFWMGGVLGGAFSTIADTGSDMRNTRALRELGQIDQDQFVSMGQQAQEQVAAFMDAENYAGALDVIKRFKAATKPSPAQQQPDQQEQAPESDQLEQEQQQVIDVAQQEEMDDEEFSAEYIRREDLFSGAINNLKEVPENPQISGVKAKILGALPNSLNAVRRALQISSEAGSQTAPATQRVTLGEVETAIDNIIAQRKNATKKGNQQQSNQQQPQETPQGEQATQASDSNSAQQVQADATPAPTPAEEVTPEVKAQKKAKVRKRAEKLAKTPVEAVSTPDVDQVTPEAENAATGQPEAIAEQSEEINEDEIDSIPEVVSDIQSELQENKTASEKGIGLINKIEAAWDRYNNGKLKSEKRGAIEELQKLEAISDDEATSLLSELESGKKTAQKKDEQEPAKASERVQDQLSEFRNLIIERISKLQELIGLKRLMIGKSEYSDSQYKADKAKAQRFLARVNSAEKLTQLEGVYGDLNDAADDKSIITDEDISKIVKASRTALMKREKGAREQAEKVAQATTPTESGMLFQDEQAQPIIDNSPQYKMLSELSNRELSTAKGIIQALRRLGINEQVSDTDKMLALEIKQAVNSGSMSEELISKLNEAAPSRAVFQNQVNNLKGFGPTTKRVIMMHFDVMALNYLKTGESLAAFWAQVPQITVVDSIDAGARGALISGGLGDMSEVRDAQRSDFATVTDVALPASDGSVINIPFSPIPNRIVLVRGKYNASTLMHENDHNMIITGMAQRVVEAEDGGVDLWNEVLAELGMERNQPWTVEAHEKWARAREAWIRGGEVKSIFTRVFNALKAIFTNLYTSGALDKYKNPTLEKAFVKIYDINTAPAEDIKAKVARDTGYEASQLLAHVPANKLEKAQMIIESAKLIPDIGAAKAHIIATATTYENDQQAFTDDEVFAMVGMLERVYTGNQAPLGLPLYDEVQNHFDGVNALNTYYGAARQKGKPRDIANPNTLYQDSAIETTSTQENVNRFNELTKDLYPTRLTYIASFEADEWKRENPEKHQEIIEMRKGILKNAGFYQENGELVPFYHGTPTDFFDTFNTNRSGYNFGAGAYFSKNEIFAEGYTGKKYSSNGERPSGSTLFKVYLKIQNPYITDTKSGFSDPAYKLERTDRAKYDELAKRAAKRILNDESRFNEIGTNEVMNEMVRDMGHDSIIYNFYGNDMEEVIVFEPEQIKAEDPISRGFKITPDKWASQVNPSILYQDGELETTDVIQQAITSNAGEVLYQYAGERANTPQFLRDSLDTAKAMAAAGKGQEEIRAITGWFPSPYDGKMRWEIPDNEASFNMSEWMRLDERSPTKLGDLLNHDSLYSAYPEIEEINVVRSSSYKSSDGSWSPDDMLIEIGMANGYEEISLNTLLHEIQHAIQDVEGFSRGSSAYEYINSIFVDGYGEKVFSEMNEISESVRLLDSRDRDIVVDRVSIYYENNGIDLESIKNPRKALNVVKPWRDMIEYLKDEGHYSGDKSINLLWSSVDKIYQDIKNLIKESRIRYDNSAGEIEARDVEARANLTPEQRAAIAPYSSENIAPQEAIVLYQAGDQSSFDDNTIRSAIGMGHAMIQMAARLGVQINHTKIGKEIATLVNSQNNRSGKKLKEATIAKAANSLIKQFQEMHSNLQPKEQRNLVNTAYEKMFVIEDMGLDADSYARRNNIHKRKDQPIEEQRRIEVQEVVRGLYNTFKNARANNYFANNVIGQISPEFRVIADRIISLVGRGIDNVMGAFNSTNEDLLIRFADNINAYNKKLYTGTPEFVEQFSNTITEVEDAVTQHLVSQFYALNSAYLDATGISKEIDALLAQLPPMPEETAMEHYERMSKIIQQVEAEMFKISSEGNPNEQSESGKRAAKVREKREEIARTHQRVLIEKFPTVEDFIAYKREKDGGLHTPEIEENLRENYEYATTENITELNDPALRDFNSVALTMIVGGSNTSFLNVSKRKWRREKVQSWHDLADRMAGRVGNNSLVRAIHRGASRSNTLDRLANWFDSTFQSNVENFHVWIDRFSQYAPVRDWFENQFFKDFTTGVFTQAETARKAAEYWVQNDVIKSYNDDIDNTVQANPYLWVMSMLSQYNLGSDPNKGFAKAVTRAKTSIARTIKQGRSQNLVGEASRNREALDKMLEGIDINADNSYDMFMAKAYNENRLGEGDPVKTQKRAELLSNISNYFQQDLANQKFIRENILGQPFVTVVNYLPLKAMKTDGSVDAWDWTNIEPKTERLVGATNVNARSNDERQETLGDDRAYGMDFFNMVERKAVKNALDRHAMLPVAVLADSFRTETKNIEGVSVSVPKDEAIKTIFGENPEVVGELAIIKEKITHQMVQIYGVTEPPTEFVGGLKKMIGLVQGGMLSGVGQVVQQSTAAIVDYCGREAGNMAYMFDAMLYWSKNYEKVREWLRVNNPDIYERGNTQGILEFERHINNAGSELNSMLDKGWRGVDQIRKFMTISLRYGDKIGAELIFLAEHMKAVRQSGQTPFGGDYDINDYNNPAFTDRANGQIARFIGPSSAAGRSYWMSDHKQAYFLLRALTGSFQSSAHNMSSQMLAAARNIRGLKDDNSEEGRAERQAEYRKIGSIMAQQATFTGVRFLVGGMITYALVGAIREAWDDEEGAVAQAELELEKARKKYYPSKADKEMAIAMAERKLADAKSIRRAVINMKQQASGDALMKSMVRDQLQNLHIVGSVGDGLVPKVFMMVPNSLAQQSHIEAQDQIIKKLKKEKSDALAAGDRKRAAKIQESITDAQAVEFIPYFYSKRDSSGFGGIVGGMIDPIYTGIREGVEDITRDDKDFLTARAFVPDMITYMAALGLGQADVNRIARQLQRIDDELSKNREEANKRAGEKVDKLTNKPQNQLLR